MLSDVTYWELQRFVLRGDEELAALEQRMCELSVQVQAAKDLLRLDGLSSAPLQRRESPIAVDAVDPVAGGSTP